MHQALGSYETGLSGAGVGAKDLGCTLREDDRQGLRCGVEPHVAQVLHLTHQLVLTVAQLQRNNWWLAAEGAPALDTAGGSTELGGLADPMLCRPGTPSSGPTSWVPDHMSCLATVCFWVWVMIKPVRR